MPWRKQAKAAEETQKADNQLSGEPEQRHGLGLLLLQIFSGLFLSLSSEWGMYSRSLAAIR